MTRAINFTKETIKQLPLQKIQYDVGDRRVSGLRLRINPGGSKTFILYRKIEGRPARIKLGRFPEISIEVARKMAAKLNGQIAEGRNPQMEKRTKRGELTFKELAAAYHRDHALLFTRTAVEIKSILDQHVVPSWGNLKASTITKDSARRLHRAIAEHCAKAYIIRLKIRKQKDPAFATRQDLISQRGQATANKAMTLARAVFNFGIREDLYKGVNPCLGLKKFKQESRDRFLSPLEIEDFLEAVSHEERTPRDVFLLALFTGARKSNLLSMRYEDIDFGLRRWRIPSHQAKNGDVNIVVLSRPALAILKWRFRANSHSAMPSPFVFPGNGKTGHISTPRVAFARIKAYIGASDIRIHDLRRTLGSYMAIGGTSLPIIGKALNHKNQNTTAIYARLSQNPVQEAVDKAAVLMQRKVQEVSRHAYC